MNYVEIVARQSELEAEMMERQEELQKLQQERIAVAQQHEDLQASQVLSSGDSVDISLQYGGGDSNIFCYNQDGKTVVFSPEDYNEMSQFFSKYNDAIFSYMSEISKPSDSEEEEA